MDTFIGIDVSQDSLDLHVRPAGIAGRVTNTPEGHRELLALLPPPTAVHRIVLEATGGLESLVAATLSAAGYSVAVVNPRQVRDFARATGRLAKTDALDAATLAHFGEAVKPVPRPLPSQELQDFREILDRREQLLQMQTAEANRLRSTRQKAVRKDIETHLAWLAKRLDGVNLQLAQAVAANLQWTADEALLRSIPGVGAQTARMLIGHLPELGRLDRRPLASLVGLAPLNRDSGLHRGLRFIVGGRAMIRKALYMAALASIKHNAVMRTYYAQLRAKGKAGKTALIAVARKLLCIANAILRTRTPWHQPAVAIA
jgi:transposase